MLLSDINILVKTFWIIVKNDLETEHVVQIIKKYLH